MPALQPKALLFASRINLYAIVLTALWTPINALVLPSRVSDMAPAVLRGSALGLITFTGIGLAVVIQPIAGMISDRLRWPQRRRAFIIWPSVAAPFLLVALGWAPVFVALLATYVALQCALNVAQAAFQALIPDLVDHDGQDTASGVKTGFDLLGNVVGLGGAGAIVMLGGSDGIVVLFLAAVAAFGAAAVFFWVPPADPPPDDVRPLRTDRWRHELRAAFEPLFKGSRVFQLAVAMRFAFFVGLYPVQRFLLYFLEDRFHIEDPIGKASVFILAAIALAAVGAVAAGELSKPFGRDRVLAVSIVVTAIGLAGLAVLPTLPLIGVAGAVLAVGAGAFQAGNWALLSSVMPPGRGSQFFGLANIATAGASAVAGLLGVVVDVGNHYLPGGTYGITFGVCTLIVLVALVPLRRLPKDGGSQTRSGQRPQATAMR
jgi:Na+/melibiose symporter-like transporter